MYKGRSERAYFYRGKFSGTRAYFAPLSSITTVSANRIKNLLLYSISKKYISNKFIRDRLDVDYEKAAEILAEFQQAGYIGDEMGNYRYPVNLTFRGLSELVRDN